MECGFLYVYEKSDTANIHGMNMICESVRNIRNEVLTFNERTFAKLRKNPLFTDHYATGSTIQVNRTVPKSQTNEPKARCAKNQMNHDARLQRSRSSRTEIPVNVQIVVNPKFPLTVLLIKITWCRRVAIPWSVAAKANIRV